jgi:predicted flap endonuclease-1-like 5' DNA nuclease
MAPSSVASDESGEEGFIVDIDAIQAHGIGAVDITKLKNSGYYTIASVHAATRRNLLKIKGFSEIKVDKVKDAIAKCQACLNRFFFVCHFLDSGLVPPAACDTFEEGTY